MSIRPRKFWSKGTLFYAVLVGVVCAATAFGLASVFAGSSATTSGATRTAIVQSGTVQSSVTASGNISAATTTSVNFATSGTVTAVDVAMGDKVSAGEALAKVDPSSAQAALTAAQDQLSFAEYNLKLAEAGPTAAQLAANQANLDQANLTVVSDEQQLSTDKLALATARTQLSSDEAAGCPTVTPPTTGATSSTTSTTTTTSTNSCTQDNTIVTNDTQTDAREQLVVEQAKASLASTKATIAVGSTPSPATISQDEALVAEDTQTVNDDEKTLSETTLTSPVSGTVTALSGSVGESVSGSSSLSTSSGGSSSPSAASSSSAGASSSSTASSSSPAFATITNLGQLEVVAGFAEADITNIKVGQPAAATLAALPNTELSGSVTAVSSTSTVSSNVVTYDVTILLNGPPSTVKIGMTANVSVITDSKSNVLELPSAAITTVGTNSTVSTLVNNKPTTQPVVVGLVGSSTTQILSGVRLGEVVVEPTVSFATGAATTAGAGAVGAGAAGGGGFAGGGGGLGGAGLGGGARG